LIRLALGLVLSACSVDPEEHPDYCVSHTDCPEGRMCVDSYCVRACIDNMPCYDGMEAEIREGAACRRGVCSADLGLCLGQVLPREEVCNGVDDDCNGMTDELADMSCSTELAGACAAGTFRCTASGRECVPVMEPSEDVCDAVDNDCDESVDEDTSVACYPTGMAGCTSTAEGFSCTGACAPGALRCVGGTMETTCSGAVTPAAAEACTMPGELGADENCNGMIDEGCPCGVLPTDPTTMDCYTGPSEVAGVGACEVGTQTCNTTTHEWGPCEGAVLPIAEACDNAMSDDDCDGTDDDIDMLGADCTDEAAMGACRDGVYACAGGALECDTPEPAAADPCDGVDNDCDGTVDDGIDLRTDPMHCGRCDNGCDGDCCASACTNVDSDPLNCGACGRACEAGQACCGGECAAPDSSRCLGCATDCEAMGQICCGGSCVDPMNSESHCGACGRACTGGTSLCCAGSCVERDTDSHCGESCSSCEGSDFCCDGACVSPTSAHCTSCAACPATGPTCCAESGGCTDRMTDRNNCGACGNVCAAGEECMGGACLTNCGGTWVDTQTNRNHCGECSHRCALITGGTCPCEGGRCTGLCI
jgi:hypothetical protein